MANASLSITSRCNFRCGMCDVGQRNAKSSGLYSNWKDKKEIDAQSWFKIIDSLSIERVHIVGTEPLLYDELDVLLEGFHKRHVFIYLTTNGWLIDKWKDALASYCDLFCVSVDGIEKTHDVLRGVPGAYRRALDGVISLKERGVKTRASFAITPVNTKDIVAVYDLFAEHGIPVVYNHFNFIRPQSCVGLCSPSNMYFEPSDVNLNDIVDAVCKRPKIMLSPNVRDLSSLKRYYNDIPLSNVFVPCDIVKYLANGSYYAIAPDGEFIVSARCWIKAKLGNALDGKPDVREVERLLKMTKKMPPPCQRLCCGLFQ